MFSENCPTIFSMTSVGIQEMKRFERQLFSQFLFYITLMM